MVKINKSRECGAVWHMGWACVLTRYARKRKIIQLELEIRLVRFDK